MTVPVVVGLVILFWVIAMLVWWIARGDRL
jgi:hypothetical protein